MFKQVTLKVEGMSCGHCKMTVEQALLSVPGVKDVVADLKAKTVKITYSDGKVALPDLRKTIADAGYEVVPDSNPGT